MAKEKDEGVAGKEEEEGKKKDTSKMTVEEIEDSLDELLADEELDEKSMLKIVKTLAKSNKKYKRQSAERLQEVMDKKHKIQEMEKQEEEKAKEALKDKEEFKKLYEEAEPKMKTLMEDFAKTQEYFGQMLENKRAEIPEEDRDLIPKGLDVRAELDWLDIYTKKHGDKKSLEEKGKETSVNTSGTGPASSEEEMKHTTQSKIMEEMKGLKTQKELEKFMEKYRHTGVS